MTSHSAISRSSSRTSSPPLTTQRREDRSLQEGQVEFQKGRCSREGRRSVSKLLTAWCSADDDARRLPCMVRYISHRLGLPCVVRLYQVVLQVPYLQYMVSSLGRCLLPNTVTVRPKPTTATAAAVAGPSVGARGGSGDAAAALP